MLERFYSMMLEDSLVASLSSSTSIIKPRAGAIASPLSGDMSVGISSVGAVTSGISAVGCPKSASSGISENLFLSLLNCRSTDPLLHALLDALLDAALGGHMTALAGTGPDMGGLAFGG